ncbi:MAG: hypothetical protein IJY10_00860 [Lachnospiraceae bacterium]|nr:hypothetical protein [Lachnospiraceae bacterium]
MLRKFFKRKVNQVFAWLLVGVMTLSTVGVTPVYASEAAGQDGSTVTTYDFAVSFDAIEGTTGELNGVVVDATNGKLSPNGCCAQFNAGTVLKVPVTGACTLAVEAHAGNYALYTINGVQAGTENAVTEVEYAGEAGYVEIVSTGSAYIKSVTVTTKTTTDSESDGSGNGNTEGGNTEGGNSEGSNTEIPTSWTFAVDFTAIEGTTGEYNGIVVDATNGKLSPNGGQSAQFNAGTILKVPVAGPCVLTVEGHAGQYALYTINGVQASTENAVTEVEYAGEAGYVEIVSTGPAYIKNITVTAKEAGSEGGNTDGGNTEGGNTEGGNTDGGNTESPNAWDFAVDFTKIEGATGEFNGLVVDATSGKFSPNGCCAQFNKGTILKVPVLGPCTLTVEAHAGNYALYTINGEAASTAEAISVVEYTGEAGFVEIISTGGAYIKSIALKYPEITQKTYVLNVADLTAEKVAAAYNAGTDNYFVINPENTIEAKGGKSFTVNGTEISVSSRLKTGGDGKTNKKSIGIAVTNGWTADITVCVASSSSSADAQLVLFDANGDVISGTVCFVERGVATVAMIKDVPAGTYYIGSKKATAEATVEGACNIYYIQVVENVASAIPKVSSVTAVADSNDTTGKTVVVSFTGSVGEADTEYIVEASKDGSKWIKVGTLDGTAASGSVTVDLSAKGLGYGDWQFRVSGSNKVVASETISYKAATYTLTGTYTNGLGEEANLLTDIVFTAPSSSYYEIPKTVIDTEKGTYSVVLEKGTAYTMAAVGVDEYSLITPAKSFTYSADTTLDLEFKKKVFYPITISLGSTPDLSEKELTLTFTHEDGAVYTYDSLKNIALRDGKYSVAIGGDMEQMAYGIKTGATLTVDGAAVNHAITFEALTSWSFGPNDFSGKIEKATGWYKGLYVDATTGKLAAHSSGTAQFNDTTVITVPVSGPCKITVTAYQAAYALYTVNGVSAGTSSDSFEVEYTGKAGTIDVVSTGSAYIASISLSYPVQDVEFVGQSVMPFVPEDDTDANTEADTDGIPRRNVKDNLTVSPVGQKLNLSQVGGSFADKFTDTDKVSYYLFPKTDKANKLEFDLLVTESKATSNSSGFFGGVFTDNYVYSLGLRAGGQKIRGIYSKNGGLAGGSFAGAGSPTEELVGLNRPIHYEIEFDSASKKYRTSISFLDDEGVLQERSFSQGALQEPDGNVPTEFYYGFALANVSVTITNMIYTDANGNVLYDQNACYYPVGAAPTVNAVTATSDNKTYVDLSWTGTVAEGDATYVVEVKVNDKAWQQLSEDVTGFNYRYEIPAGVEGKLSFRVCGQLGKETLGGKRSAYVTMAETVTVKGALTQPVVTSDAPMVGANATTGIINLDWQDVVNAEYYQVFRYSYDQGADAAVCIADKVKVSSYADATAKVDMPYYYYVKAVAPSLDNESPVSKTVWNVVTTKRDGNQVIYGMETEDIFLTKKSYDTVFTSEATVEGLVYAEGTLQVVVNGTKVSEKVMAEGESFAYKLTLLEGRNDVELILVKEDETTRRALNFVYLTNYDYVVDASFDGKDGDLNDNNIPVYKTVQAAVNAVPATNTETKVILVMAGNYEERLVVETPYISLIGQDRVNTLIHCYPGQLGTNYEAGGDMDKRCATYIKSAAKGFSAENISFANDYVYGTNDGKSNKSADAIRVEADGSTFVNVKFTGVQDTLYMHSGYQYYEKCLIEGLVDYIYSGDAARSVFYDCELRFVYEPTKTSGYVCAPKTATSAEYGLVFLNCAITAQEGCNGTGYLLARPWGADAYIAWINCYMGKVIYELAPYGDMSGNLHEDARFFEYGTFGPGFLVNEDRRQISESKAEEFAERQKTGVSNKNTLSRNHYVGDLVTDVENIFDNREPNDDKYLFTDSKDDGLAIYTQEGYASYYEVTGGGLLKETNSNYYAVDTAEEFLDALLKIKETGKDSVIELKADINLGSKEVNNFSYYSSKKLLTAYSAQALTHPTLIESGVSKLNIENMANLTIFSKNGASIKHANITIKKSENIIIRNIKFDELWEWDEATGGDYDRNDWDYMTLDDGTNGVWIDHCTFYKAYDGIVDIKNPNPTNYVTISWCEFLPGSKNDTFFNVMMEEIYANPAKYPTYQAMQKAGMTEYQIYMYAYGQKKTHLFGQSDDAVSAKGIKTTLANNYYFNSMDRMPRLRYGDTHVYNCIMDSQQLLNIRLSIQNENYAKKVVSNGAASTNGAQVLLQNCYISGIQNALNSGNGSSPSGYINAIDSLYYMDGKLTKLEPKVNTTKEGEPLLVLDADSFLASLPYEDYNLYEAEDLYSIVVPRSGAGKVQMSTLQWLKAEYNVEKEEENNPGGTIDIPEIDVEIIPSEKVEEKLDEVLEILPEEVKEKINEKVEAAIGKTLESAEDIIHFLEKKVTEDKGACDIIPDLRKEQTVVNEVKVKIEVGGQMVEVTEENKDLFPKEGIEIVIPYPQGVDKDKFDFVIGHMVMLGCNGKEAGDMEYFNPTETEEGLKIRIYSASPFIIGYKASSTGTTGGNTGTGNTGNSGSTAGGNTDTAGSGNASNGGVTQTPNTEVKDTTPSKPDTSNQNKDQEVPETNEEPQQNVQDAETKTEDAKPEDNQMADNSKEDNQQMKDEQTPTANPELDPMSPDLGEGAQAAATVAVMPNWIVIAVIMVIVFGALAVVAGMIFKNRKEN